MNCSNELSCVSRLTAQPITATTSRESENPQDQPHKKQRKSCPFATYKNSLPSTWSYNCEAQLVKYLNAINEPAFSADDEPNICNVGILMSATFICLYFLNTCKLGTRWDNFFSKRPHRAGMSDTLLETLENLKCNWVFSSWEKNGKWLHGSKKQVYAMHSFYSVQSCLVVFVSRIVFN